MCVVQDIGVSYKFNVTLDLSPLGLYSNTTFASSLHFSNNVHNVLWEQLKQLH